VLSRGDSSLAAVLADIQKEALPDWKEAVEKHQIDIKYFAHQRWDSVQKLPWNIIDSGTPVNQLADELQKASRDQIPE
jgi:hypothetical protein